MVFKLAQRTTTHAITLGEEDSEGPRRTGGGHICRDAGHKAPKAPRGLEHPNASNAPPALPPAPLVQPLILARWGKYGYIVFRIGNTGKVICSTQHRHAAAQSSVLRARRGEKSVYCGSSINVAQRGRASLLVREHELHTCLRRTCIRIATACSSAALLCIPHLFTKSPPSPPFPLPLRMHAFRNSH